MTDIVIDTKVIDKEDTGEQGVGPDAVPVPVVTPVETVPESPVKTVSSIRSSGTRRKPVPPPKNETTLPSWITQVKKPRRRPVSLASYTLTISDQSVGEGPSNSTVIPTSTSTPPVPSTTNNIPNLDPSILAKHPLPVQQTHDHPSQLPKPISPDLPTPKQTPFIPVLATTKDKIPMRRVTSLPPYGPGPTRMYILPTNMTPSQVRAASIRRKPSRRRWRPSPESVRKTVVVIRKLQDITDASLRIPPSKAGGLDFGKGFGEGVGSVKRVVTQSFNRNGSRKLKGKEVMQDGQTEGITEERREDEVGVEEDIVGVEETVTDKGIGSMGIGGNSRTWDVGRTFGSVKRVAYQSFKRKPTPIAEHEPPLAENTLVVETVEEHPLPSEPQSPIIPTIAENTTPILSHIREPESPKPPATYAQYLHRPPSTEDRPLNKRKFPTIQYKQFLKRTRTEPSTATSTASGDRKRKMTVTLPQYNILMKRMKTEPISGANTEVGTAPGDGEDEGKGKGKGKVKRSVSMRARGFNAGQWIDEHFDFFPPSRNPPPKKSSTSVPTNPTATTTTTPIPMIEQPISAPPSATITTIPLSRPTLSRNEKWITTPRTPSLPNFRHRTTKLSKSVSRGIDRIIINTSAYLPRQRKPFKKSFPAYKKPSFPGGGSIAGSGTRGSGTRGSGTRGKGTGGKGTRDIGVGEGVRIVTPAEERMSLGSESLGSRSEIFHTEGEIVEAEEVIEMGRVHEVKLSERAVERASSPVLVEVSQLGERSTRSTALETERGEQPQEEEQMGEGSVGFDGVGNGPVWTEVATDK